MKRGPFIALSATFPSDDAVVEAGERAAWLYVNMACDSRLQRADGMVREHRLDRLGVSSWKPRLNRLMDVGLVERTEYGLYLPGYPKWNQTEHDYRRASAEGKVAACRRHHSDCHRTDCADARAWLAANGYADG